MKLLIVSAVALFAGISTALPSALADAGYVQQDFTFEGPLHAGDATNITITGSGEEIYNKLRELNPNYDSDFAHIFEKREAEAEAHWLNKRLTCGGFRAAEKSRIYQGISYLRGINGNCGVNSGPRVCSRVSCSYDSKIAMCNDNNGAFSKPCGDVAAGADAICGSCDGSFVSGQIFYSDNWNVIVEWDSC